MKCLEDCNAQKFRMVESAALELRKGCLVVKRLTAIFLFFLVVLIGGRVISHVYSNNSPMTRCYISTDFII